MGLSSPSELSSGSSSASRFGSGFGSAIDGFLSGMYPAVIDAISVCNFYFRLMAEFSLIATVRLMALEAHNLLEPINIVLSLYGSRRN